MGWSVHCLVVRGLDAPAVAERLGRTLAGPWLSEEDATASSRATWPSVATRGDGVLVVADPHFVLADDSVLAALSASGVVVHQLAVEEHVMASAASCWQGGEQEWSVVHEAEDDLTGVQVTGEPPDVLADLLAAARASSGSGPDVDHVFDVPVDLFAAETGFRHDELHEVFGDGPVFASLGVPPPEPARRRPWYRRG